MTTEELDMNALRRRCIAIALGLLAALSLGASATPNARVILNDLQSPWSLDWLSTTEVLITERPGRLLRVNLDTGARTPVKGLPPIAVKSQGGLFDVRLKTLDGIQWVYLSLSGPGADGALGTEVWRAELDGSRLTNQQQLFVMSNKTPSGRHFGGRLVLTDQHLFLTLGDRGDRPRSQAVDDHAGSVIRLNLDGSIPKTNPYLNTPGARPELFSIGHRNPQGAALHPATGALYIHEHGPQGGDEINRVEAGKNYGWPVITYGRNYGLGTPIGEGTEKPGMEQPLLYWDPSIAPSGMAFYTGDQIPAWTDSLFVGALKAQMLVRLEMDQGIPKQRDRLYRSEFGRIRDIRQGPDGALYLLTDSGRGLLVRIDGD
jgi:glucose/arabinose dehydrogenase